MSENESGTTPKETFQKMQSLSINENSDSAAETDKKNSKDKIDILLKHTGDVPIMKQRKWTVDGNKPISWIIEFIKKYVKMGPDEKLFIYVNQTFAPSPDQIMKNLHECYATEGRLVLHYCRTPAWG